ncbi:hypothetical protein B0J12DRAFT_788909, partial [Macrophomina phaseolina]
PPFFYIPLYTRPPPQLFISFFTSVENSIRVSPSPLITLAPAASSCRSTHLEQPIPSVNHGSAHPTLHLHRRTLILLLLLLLQQIVRGVLDERSHHRADHAAHHRHPRASRVHQAEAAHSAVAPNQQETWTGSRSVSRRGKKRRHSAAAGCRCRRRPWRPRVAL